MQLFKRNIHHLDIKERRLNINLYSCINTFMHEKDMCLTKICIQLDTNPRIELKGYICLSVYMRMK